MPAKLSAGALRALALIDKHGAALRSDNNTAWAKNADVSTIAARTVYSLHSKGLVEIGARAMFGAQAVTLTDQGRTALERDGAQAQAQVKAEQEHRLTSSHSVFLGGSPIRGMGGSSGGTAACSCGERFRSNEGVAEAKAKHRDHVAAQAAVTTS